MNDAEDFGKLLEQWEESKPDAISQALEGRELHPVKQQPIPKSKLKRLKPQRTLDLHGMTAEQASEAVSQFLRESAKQGIQKVLIIHGKGYHSLQGKPVLKSVVYRILDASPLAGERGIPDRSLGGSGAVWVLIKSKSV
jgi:DNA-nicking Smr family endonuclease